MSKLLMIMNTENTPVAAMGPAVMALAHKYRHSSAAARAISQAVFVQSQCPVPHWKPLTA